MDHVIVIDFETYYDADYSLEKMPTAEYVLSDKFQIIGFAYKLDDQDTVWVGPNKDPLYHMAALAKLPWDNAVCVAHNAMFDGFVLEARLGIQPARYFCTAMGSRPMLASKIGSMRLGDIAAHLGLGMKGQEVYKAKGMRAENFSPGELEAYAEYCKNDVVLTYMIYHLLMAWYEKHNRNVA